MAGSKKPAKIASSVSPSRAWVSKVCQAPQCTTRELKTAKEGLRVFSLVYTGLRASKTFTWWHRSCWNGASGMK